MPTPRRSARQLVELVAAPGKALTDDSYWTEPLCHRWLDHVVSKVHFQASEALSLAILGVRLAIRVERRRRQRRLRDRCLLARAYGVLGSVYRANGKLERAERALDKAGCRVRDCPDSDARSDIYRRRSILELQLAQRPGQAADPRRLCRAIELAERALHSARGEIAAARAHIAFGVIRAHTPEHARAVWHAKRALAGLDPRDRPFDHTSALSLLVHALSLGDAASREQAVGYLEELRRSLPPRSPSLRARLLWAQALLTVPNRRRKAYARRLLEQARKIFLRLEMSVEALAVTAELARLHPSGAVPELCAEVLPLVAAGPIHQLVARLRAAPLIDRVALAEMLRHSIQTSALLPTVSMPRP